MNGKQRVEMLRQIDTMDRDDLRVISDAISARWDALRREAAAVLKVGDRVRFMSRRHGLVFATVTGFNRKSVAVRDRWGATWRVSPTMLTKIENEIGGENNG